MFGEQSDFFHKVFRQSAGPHDLNVFFTVDPKHEEKKVLRLL